MPPARLGENGLAASASRAPAVSPEDRTMGRRLSFNRTRRRSKLAPKLGTVDLLQIRNTSDSIAVVGLGAGVVAGLSLLGSEQPGPLDVAAPRRRDSGPSGSHVPGVSARPQDAFAIKAVRSSGSVSISDAGPSAGAERAAVR